MPRTAPPDAHPTEIFPFEVGKTPIDDRMYFEMLTWFVFGAGLNWRVMRAKWPNFQKAFANFNIAKVAKFGESDIDRLLADAGIVRNGKKIVGTVENAREMLAIKKKAGGMTPWLRAYRADSDEMIKDTKKRFHHMGDTTSRMFLTCVGAIEYETWEPTARQRAGRP
jgi:DNA-3-methyladenine glycosylase I